jgi:hypothetical protein
MIFYFLAYHKIEGYHFDLQEMLYGGTTQS